MSTSRPSLPHTSLRAQRVFMFALVETIASLRAVDAEMPDAFLDALHRNVAHLTRTGRFPETLESDRVGVELLHAFFLQAYHRAVEHHTSLSTEQQTRLHEDRHLWNQVLDALDETSSPPGGDS